jgi:hypothetical protein
MSYSYSHRYSHKAIPTVYKATPSPIHIVYKTNPSLINTATRKKSKSGINFIQELEHKEYQPFHHDINICGSSLHGLATTIQRMLAKKRKGDAIAQVDRCINARLLDIMRHNGGDSAHLNIIRILREFKTRLEEYNTDLAVRAVTYNDEEQTFKIILVGLGGRYKKSYKKHKKNIKRRRRTVRKWK